MERIKSMLYSEFIVGTGAPDNKHTYSEYERINRIYNEDNRMEKSDAYRMYRKPDELTLELMNELEDARQQARENAIEIIKLRKEIEAMQEKLDGKNRVISSLNVSLQQTLKEAEICRQHISNIIYG